MKSEKTRRRYRVRFQQQLELLFVFYWILWALFWIKNYFKTKDAIESYHDVPFTRESHGNDSDKTYLRNRKRYAWTKYINKKLDYKERIKKARRKKDQILDKSK
tara:strand:- start:377 stop:688 length:312 start_codon:yes stop_codon:yes gene_type:complete